MAANEVLRSWLHQRIKSAEVAYFTAYPTIGYARPTISISRRPVPVHSLFHHRLSARQRPVRGTPAAPARAAIVFLATGISPPAAINSGLCRRGARRSPSTSTGNHDFCTTNDGVLRSQIGQRRRRSGQQPCTLSGFSCGAVEIKSRVSELRVQPARPGTIPGSYHFGRPR